MGSISWKHVAAAAVIVLAGGVVRMLPSHGAQPLRHDHTREWRYVRVPHRTATELELRLGDISSLVAGRPVQVRCEDFSIGTPVEPGGVVQFNRATPADYSRIRPDVCSNLVHFSRWPETVSGEAAQALTVLAHEAVHLSGIRNEAVTQCYAMQVVPRVAHALGASTGTAAALATVSYTDVYPYMAPAYRSPECKPGGALDRSPGGGWPD